MIALVTGATPVTYTVHNDHLSTPKLITDQNQAIVWTVDVQAFGTAVTSGALTFNVRFPGQYFDQETGLHYNYLRYYDPTTGRYITSDPIGLAGGLNTYSYVGGNPLVYVDPLGLLPEDFYVAEEIMAEVFKGRNIPTITSCDHCRELRPFSEGIYDPDKNRITINEYDFDDGNLWNDVLSDAQAKALLQTHFHEMIHSNQNYLSRAIIQYFENYDGTGIGNKLHNRVDYWAEILANKYADEFNKRRKEAVECD